MKQWNFKMKKLCLKTLKKPWLMNLTHHAVHETSHKKLSVYVI